MVFQHGTTGTKEEGNKQGEPHACPTMLSGESCRAADRDAEQGLSKKMGWR